MPCNIFCNKAGRSNINAAGLIVNIWPGGAVLCEFMANTIYILLKFVNKFLVLKEYFKRYMSVLRVVIPVVILCLSVKCLSQGTGKEHGDLQGQDKIITGIRLRRT
jgi:hypothetical protein